jgi:hypothetical protein
VVKKSPAAKAEVLPELLIVGENVSKNRSYYLAMKEQIVRVAHGIYIPTDKMPSARTILEKHAVRLAALHFKNAAGLCYSSAFFIDSIPSPDGPRVVFMSGDYSYRVELGQDDYKIILVQSQHPPHEVAHQNGIYDYYSEKIFADPMGEFIVWVPHPELLILQNFERIKEWEEKRISIKYLQKFVQWLVSARYNGSVAAFSAGLAEMALKSNRIEEHNHAVQALITHGFGMAERYLK